MSKIIFKTALKTLLAIIVAAAIVFAVWFFGFPQSLATVGEKTGNYPLATVCMSMRYARTDDIDDLARCVEYAIFSGKDGYVYKYGNKLVEREDFASLCERRDELSSSGQYSEYTRLYKHYIFGYLAAATFARDGVNKAVEIAATANGADSFVTGNAFAVLALRVAQNGSADDKAAVLAALDKINCTDQAELQYLDNIKAILDT